MKTSDIKILHFRPESGSLKGGLTVAYTHDASDSFIVMSTAICSSRDPFVRAVGRTIAINNYFAGNTIKFPYNKYLQETVSPNEFIRSIVSSAVL